MKEVTLYIDNVYSRVDPCPSILKERLRYQTKEYNVRKKSYTFTSHSLIGIKEGLKAPGYFLTGLSSFVVGILNYKGYILTIKDVRKYPKTPSIIKNLGGGYVLRPYQIEAVEAALRERIGIIQATTGSGKSLIIAGILAALGEPALILVPGIDLLKQTKDVLEATLQTKIGVIGGGKSDRRFITLGTPRSIVAHDFSDVKIVLCDEVHSSAADTARQVLENTPSPYKIGLSATPYGRCDSKDLVTVGLFGPLIKKIEYSELVKGGYVNECNVNFLHVPESAPKLHEKIRTFTVVERLGIVENKIRNEMITRTALSFKQKTLILVRRIEHGKILNNMIANSIAVSGMNSAKERQQIKEDFISGKIPALIGSDIFSVGIDIPDVDHIIDAAGGRSPIKAIQRAGRGLRRSEKGTTTIIDFYDSFHPVLTKHSISRLKEYQAHGFNVLSK